MDERSTIKLLQAIVAVLFGIVSALTAGIVTWALGGTAAASAGVGMGGVVAGTTLAIGVMSFMSGK